MKLRKTFSLLFAACSSSLIAKDICEPCNNLQDRSLIDKMIEVERKVTKGYYTHNLRTDRYFIGTAVQAYQSVPVINVYSDEKGNSGTRS